MRMKRSSKTGASDIKKSFISSASTVIQNIFRQPVPRSRIDTSEGITKWGARNDFPQQLIGSVENSPSASSALDIWHEFIEGSGFVNPDIGEVKLNIDQDLDDLHVLLSRDLATLWGCSVLISYNAFGLPISYKHLPFEGTRLGVLNDNGFTDTIKFNPYYGMKEFDRKFTKWYYTFTPKPEQVMEQMADHAKKLEEKKIKIAYPGQVFWFGIEKPLSRLYPKPFYASSMNWFIVDEQIPLFHERNIHNNFLLGGMINKFGDPSAPAGNSDEDLDQKKTVGEVFDDQMHECMGAENGGGWIVNWMLNKDQKAEFEAFDNNANDKMFDTLQDQTTEQISIGFKTPRILLGIGQAGQLGDTQEIVNAIRVMQARTERLRNILSAVYVKVFSGAVDKTGKLKFEGEDFDIKSINPINVIPDKIFEVFTTAEKRQFANENFNVELKEQEAVAGKPAGTVDPLQAAAQAGLKGSVGGVQGILAIQQGVSAGTTTRESALEVFQLIYGFSLEEAERLLGTVEEAPVQEETVSAFALVENCIEKEDAKIKSFVSNVIKIKFS